VGLLQLGAPSERLWRLLRHAPEPDRRTYLLHGLGRLGTPADLILRRLEKERDAGVLQALILSLGEYGPEQLPAAPGGPLGTRRPSRGTCGGSGGRLRSPPRK